MNDHNTNDNDYLATWAEGVSVATAPDELRSLVAEYESIAADRRRAKSDRQLAENRAKALRNHL